jgi:hypothetical protein
MAEVKKQTLKEELDSIPFKNRDIAMIRELKDENKRLKDRLGRKKESSSSSSSIKLTGLAGLRGNLGGQNVDATKV